MAGATVTDSSTWSVQKDWDQAKLFFEIPNFHAVRIAMSAGQGVASKQISIGRSSFSLMVYPCGDSSSEVGKIGVFLWNCSKHRVVVDFTATLGNTTYSTKDQKLESASLPAQHRARGWPNFMKASDVMPGANFVLSMDIKLKKEEINGTNGEAVNKSFISIKEVEDGVEKGMQKKLGAHTAELRGHLAVTEGRMGAEIARVRMAAIDVEGELKQAEKRLKIEVDGVNGAIAGVSDFLEVLGQKVIQVERDLTEEIGKVKTPATDFIPECLVCLESLETLKIVQCMQGHKICEPCSEKEEVVACPTCKLAFLGRDLGMEASVQFMIDGNPARWSFIHICIL